MRRSAMRYEMDMTRGSILRNMVRFSIRLMFSTVLQLLYNAADMVVGFICFVRHKRKVIADTQQKISFVK